MTAGDSRVAPSDEELAARFPSLYSSLSPLLRITPGELDAYLVQVACNVDIDNTQAQAHCYFVALDGNRRPRVNDLARSVAERIVDFAIPRSQILRALEECSQSGSTAPIVELNQKARNLFAKQSRSGEGGEVLLSILTEAFLGLPQIFTKMILKTSGNMHVHGCDGIHVGVNAETGYLALYWGESKLYANASDAITACFASLAPYLTDSGGSQGTQERDLQLMRDGLDLNDNQLESALKRFLDPDDPLFKKVEYRGLCLIGANSDAYPAQPNSKEEQKLKEELETAFDGYKKSIRGRIVAENIHTFDIHAFFLPFPSVDGFRNAFRKEIGL